MSDEKPATEPDPDPDDGSEAESESPAWEASERKYPSTIGGGIYLALLALAAGGIAVVLAGDWRLGVRLLASSLAGAAAFRLVLPQRDAGMLAVRHRLVDVVLLGGTAAAILYLVSSIPNQPGQ